MSRIAVIGIVIEEREKTEKVNGILSSYGEYIIGRMGIPYREKNVNVISVVLDAPNEIISKVAGQIGKLEGVSAKTLYSTEFKEGQK